MIFYDTCSLLNNYNKIFSNRSEKFVISNITLRELEKIKTSKTKDDETKYRAKKLCLLLSYDTEMYNIINYQKDWDTNYIDPNPILFNDNDSRIVVSAFIYQETHPDCIFVTDDLSCFNLARNLGVHVQGLTKTKDINYKGYNIHQCFTDNDLSEFYDRLYSGNSFGLLNNQYLVVKNNDKVIDCYVYRNGTMEQIQFNIIQTKMFGDIKPLDFYQRLAIDSLKNNKITMLRGNAGTGKSYLGLGYLFECLECGKISKIIIFCNTVATAGAAKLGFYPGDRTSKLLDSQIGNFLESKIGDRAQIERMLVDGTLILLPMADIRGFDTTGMNAGIYITEAQNLNIDLMKLALQRIGEDSFCVLDGDSETQVDLGLYAGFNNGMRRVSEIFKGQPFYGEVTLPICHRSQIAKIAELM